MNPEIFDLIAGFAVDPDHGWSIGSFGAIGEFVRDADEPATIERGPSRLEIVTPRGAMRVAPSADLVPLAWDSLSGDGESWGHALAFCCARPATPDRAIRALGHDGDALRPQDRGDRLFDMGVGSGAVIMALRTSEPALIAALEAVEGTPLLSAPALMGEVLRAQPHRVLLSPAGRIEVFQPIPPPDGTSPEGPHTHLLTRLVPKDRAHSANVPIPDGMQAALTVHPRSPWRDISGERHNFMPAHDAAFAPYLTRFGLAEDRETERALHALLDGGALPGADSWPQTRRGRAKARILLRRMAAAGDRRVAPWRAMFDRAPIESDIEEGEEA